MAKKAKRQARMTGVPPESARRGTGVGAVLREGAVAALAGAFKVGAEVGRLATRASEGTLGAADRIAAGARSAPADVAPSPRKSARTRARRSTPARQSA